MQEVQIPLPSANKSIAFLVSLTRCRPTEVFAPREDSPCQLHALHALQRQVGNIHAKPHRTDMFSEGGIPTLSVCLPTRNVKSLQGGHQENWLDQITKGFTNIDKPNFDIDLCKNLYKSKKCQLQLLNR